MDIYYKIGKASFKEFIRIIKTHVAQKLSDVYTKTEVNNLISALPKFTISVVTSLPDTDISNTTIYLLSDGNKPGNLYKEYIYIDNKWELLGAQNIDLSNYYNKTEVNGLLDSKQNVLTFDENPTATSDNPVKSKGIKTYVDNKYTLLDNAKQNKLTFDESPVENSDNPVKSKGIRAYTYNRAEIDAKIAAVLATIKNAEAHGY
jgi:hypothetical protein